jgi:hypothetical protein
MTLSQSGRASGRSPRREAFGSSSATARRPARVRAIRPPRPAFDRRAALTRVLALWPGEVDDLSAAGRQDMLARLRRALRAERRRGIAGHWTYDLARHVELLHLYRQELAMVRAMNATRQGARASVSSIR